MAFIDRFKPREGIFIFPNRAFWFTFSMYRGSKFNWANEDYITLEVESLW
jgi:hypothetical protein